MRLSIKFLLGLLLVASSCLGAVRAEGEGGNIGDLAPDFPPGSFSDGKQYHLSDYRGQVVVLFFYEQKCPTCRATIPGRNKIVKRYQGKPIKFIAVGAGDAPAEVRSFLRETNLAMPVFADTRSAMEKAYGFRISLRNIYQVRVIGPDGRVAGYDMEPSTIDEALAWKPDATAQQATAQDTASTSEHGAPAPGGAQPPAVKKTKAHQGPRKDLIGMHNQAVTAIENHQCAAAIEKLKAILKIDPNYRLARENLEVAYTNYGVELFGEGKLAEAEPVLKQALELASQLYRPDHEHVRQAKVNYASILHGLGRAAEADALLGRAPEPGPSAPPP